MKEIDFLPEWYKSGRQRQISYRTQLLGLGGVLVMMIAWNFVTAHSISKARAEVEQGMTMQAEAKSISREFAGIKSEMTFLHKKVKSMEEIDSRIDFAGVLAEMSFLIDDNIVLSKVEFVAEKFVSEHQRKTTRRTGTAARAAVSSYAGGALPLGDARFRVVINGVATDAGDIAELICKLEESPYFCLVYPSFSRNRDMKTGKGKNFQVSEFEITCYLANYREK